MEGNSVYDCVLIEGGGGVAPLVAPLRNKDTNCPHECAGISARLSNDNRR